MLNIEAVPNLAWEELYGLTDDSGTFVVEPIYRELYDRGDGYYSAMDSNGSIGIIDLQGKVIIPVIYNTKPSVTNGVIVTHDRNRAQLFSLDGNSITPQYTAIQNMEDGRFIVQDGPYFGIVNTEGQEITPIIYAKIGEEQNALRRVEKDGQAGFINSEGHEQIPTQYTDVFPLYNGVIITNKNDTYGVISPIGETVIPAQFEHIGHTGDGQHLMVTLNGKVGLYDYIGNEITKPEFDKIAGIEPEGLVVEKEGKWFLIDLEGNELISAQNGWREIFTSIEDMRKSPTQEQDIFDKFDTLDTAEHEIEHYYSR